ncbi:hypothetical protein D3C80_1540790 [compost metagenome]
MRLMSDSVDRHAFIQQHLHQLVQPATLYRIVRTIIVYVEHRIRSSRLARSAEGCLDIIGTRNPVPFAGTHAVRVRRLNDLVHDIP